MSAAAPVREQLAVVPRGPDDRSDGTDRRRVLMHSSGFAMSPYSDIKPAGEDTKAMASGAARRLWHRSQGSPG